MKMNDGKDDEVVTQNEIEIRLHWDVAKQTLAVESDLSPIQAFPIVGHALDTSLKCCLATILLMPSEEQPEAVDTLMTALVKSVPSLAVLCTLHAKLVQEKKP